MHSTICRRRVRRRRGRRGSTCMFLMTNRNEKTGLGERQGGAVQCKYVTRVFSCVFNSKRNANKHLKAVVRREAICRCWMTLSCVVVPPAEERLSLAWGLQLKISATCKPTNDNDFPNHHNSVEQRPFFIRLLSRPPKKKNQQQFWNLNIAFLTPVPSQKDGGQRR